MSSILRIVIATLLAGSLSLGVMSCGDAGSSNNQGTSFTATRYCQDSTCAAGSSGAIVALSADRAALTPLDPLSGQILLVAMEFTNRLSDQFVRLDRIECDYTVPGSSPALSIPLDSDAVGIVIEAGGTAAVEFGIVSPDLFAFLNASRNSLPELPFRAVANCQGVGVTQAGDTLVTNSLNYLIQFSEFAECCTGTGVGGLGGFQTGPGTGGDLVTTEGVAGTGNATAGATSETATLTPEEDTSTEG